MLLSDINENLQNKEDLASKMKKAGWNPIGSGVHGTAWVKVDQSRKYVLKAFGADTGYFHFYNMVRKNQGNQHLPVLFGSGGITKLEFEDKTFLWMVKLEKLSPLAMDTTLSRTIDVVNQCMRQEPYNFFNPSTVHETVEIFSEAFWGAPADKKIQDKFKDIMHTQPEYYRTLLMLNNYKESISTEIFWDLHANNVVSRGGSTLVILDPWVSYANTARQDMIDRIRDGRKQGASS